MTHTVETTLTVCATGKERTPVGDIDVRISYRSTPGRPARINYNEHDHPAEGAEIDVYEVEMLNAPPFGSRAVYIPAWDWLYDWASDWANENGDELAAAASLNVRSILEDKADGEYEQRRVGIR